MPGIHYDSIGYNADMLLHLPFTEGTGIITHDLAKPHHIIDIINAPTWGVLGLNFIILDGATQYLDAPNADTADLGFTSGDYALSAWIYIIDTSTSENIMGRYEMDVGGWELYWFGGLGVNYMTLRHHHAGGATTRTACNSTGWTPGQWWHLGISRVGNTAVMYRNGLPLTTTHSTGGLIDPEATASDLVIGARYTKNTDYFEGSATAHRIWNRALSAQEWRDMYQREKGNFP